MCLVSLEGAFTGSGTQINVKMPQNMKIGGDISLFSWEVPLVLAHSAVYSAVNFSEVKVLILKVQPMLRWVDHHLTV